MSAAPVQGGQFDPPARPRFDPYIDACDPWCAHVETGHEFQPFPQERRHVGQDIGVALSLMPPLSTKEPIITSLRVYLERDSREVEAHVTVSLDGTDPVTLRLVEATVLRDALTMLLRQAQGPQAVLRDLLTQLVSTTAVSR